MNRWSCGVLLLCAVFLLAAPPQPSRAAHGRSGAATTGQAPVTAVASLGGSLKDAYVDGNSVYLLEGANLTVLDISEPAVPRLRSRTPVPGIARQVVAADGFVYLLGFSLNVLWIYDVRAPAAPVLVGQRFFGRGFYRMQLEGGALWLKTTGEIDRFDLSDPARPMLTSTFVCDCYVQVSGTLAYLLDRVTSLRIWDLTDPHRPLLRGEIVPVAAPPGEVYYTGLALSGKKLSIAATLATLTPGVERRSAVTLDVGDPSKPVVLATAAVGAEHLIWVGDRLVVLSRGELQVYTMADLAKPTLVFSQALSVASYQAVGGTFYAVDPGAWSILDLGGASGAVLRGQYQVPGALTVIHDVTPAGQRLYAHLADGIQIIDVSDPLSPTLQARIPVQTARAPDIDGTRLLVPSEDGLRLVDASDPLSPTVRAVLPHGLMGQIEGNLAYVITGAGLQILDISDFASPVLLGSTAILTTTIYPYQLLVAGGRAYIGTTYPQGCKPGCPPLRLDVQVVDVTNPQQPRAGGHVTGLDAYFEPSSWAASGTTLFIASNKLYVIDARTIDTPVLSDYPLGGSVNTIQIADGRAYVSGSGGLATLDLADPLHPVKLSSFGFGPEGAARVAIGGGRAYVLSSGLRVLDIRNPSSPLPLGMYGSYAKNVAVVGAYAYLAMDDGGLQIVEIHPEGFIQPLLLPLVHRSS